MRYSEALELYGQCRHRVTITAPLNLPDAELHTDPYVLGCSIKVTAKRTTAGSQAPIAELFDLIAARSYQGRPGV